jgi:predicted nuclease of restriction endonuclease-like RecB superfamily
MLPKSLLVAQKRRDKIKPIYVKLNKENLEIANLIIQTYKDHLGRKKGELDSALENLEEIGYDYRFIRGLSTLLDRKCKITTNTPIESSKIRRKVFHITRKNGLPTTNQARKKFLQAAAQQLKLSPEQIEDYLYADLEDQQIVESFEEISAQNLLKWYNLSLTQTLLFLATELCFTATGNWQNIFRTIKWLGLIYNIQKIDENYVVRVDGPASLFKLNRKYGTKLAKLLPQIIANKKWRITAKILRYKRDTQLLNLELDNIKYNEILLRPESEPGYDSSVEKNFETRFKALNTGWKIEREPEFIPVGKWVMIPDFKLQKDKMRVYLEVAGFWTPKYIQNKITKLQLLNNIDFIVVANQKLACQKLKKLQDRLEIIFYNKRIPLKPLLKILKKKEESGIKKDIECLEEEMFSNLQDSVIELSKLANKFDVQEESIKRFLENKQIKGYMNLGEILIKDTKLTEIKKKLSNSLDKEDVSYTEAVKIIEQSGGKYPARVLEILNFGVKWQGIDPNLAKIYIKISSRSKN